MEQYSEAFARNDVDGEILASLTAEDLTDIGVTSVGHRRRILDAIARLGTTEGPSSEKETQGTGAEAEAERRQVTVVFADLSHFTQLSNELGAERTHELLNRYFDLVDGIIEAYGGSIDKHIGDNVMGVFGAPRAHGNDPERAVRAAAEIHQALEKLSQEQGRQLQAHIGIASGQVVASGTGSQAHREYTVTGETVNLASRLQDAAAPGETLISDAVHRSVARLLDCVDLGEIQVKGFAGPIRVWRATELRAMGLDRDAQPLVGRRLELRQFTAIVEECLETGYGRAMMVRGEAGIGKTRLIVEFADLAASRGFAVHRSLALDFGAAKGQDAIRLLVRSLLGLAAEADEKQRRSAADLVTAEGFLGPDQRVFLNDLLDLPQSGELHVIYDAMDNSRRNAGKQETVVQLVAKACEKQPTMIVVEDVQWADKLSLAHLAAIASAVASCQGLLVATSRVEGDPLDQAWRASLRGSALTTIDLAPLQEAEAREIARALMTTDSQFVQDCIARAEGNPLFLEHLLRSADSGLDGDVPDTIQSLVQAELDRLDAADKRALQAASVIGQRFSATALAYLLDVPHYECDELTSRHLVKPLGDTLVFPHALIREAIYDSLVRDRRRELHRRAAEWFDGEDLVLRAEHLERAEEPEAVPAYLAASEAEAAEFRDERALELAERAYRIAQTHSSRIAPGLLRAELMRELGRTQESMRAFQDLLSDTSEDIDSCRAWIGIASCVRLLGGYDEGIVALDAAEPLARRHTAERELSQIAYYRGCLLFAAGDMDACLACHGEARDRAARIGDSRWEAQALSGLGDAYYGKGLMHRSLDHFRQCSRLCQEGSFGKIEAGSIHMRGVVRRYLNEFREAIDDVKQASDTAGRLGNTRTEMVAVTLLGEMLLDAGELQAALDAFDRGLAVADRLGNSKYRAYIVYEYGRGLWYDLERWDEAAARLHEALELAHRTDITFVGARALAALALVHSGQGGPWRDTLEQGEQVLAAGCIAHNFLWFYRDAAEAALGAEDWDRAEHYAAELESFTSEEPLPWADFFIRRARALAAAGRAEGIEEARRDLRSLLEQGESIGLRAALPAMQAALGRT